MNTPSNILAFPSAARLPAIETREPWQSFAPAPWQPAAAAPVAPTSAGPRPDAARAILGALLGIPLDRGISAAMPAAPHFTTHTTPATMKTEKDIQPLADIITADQLAEYTRQGYASGIAAGHHRAKIHMGKKFARVDVGTSGKYMVDLETGDIYGCKAYGVVHRGHRYGNLETIHSYQWGGYGAIACPQREIDAGAVAAAVAAVPAKVTPAGQRFEVGQVLTARSACDHDTIYSAVVVAVGPAMVTILENGLRKTVKIHTDQHDGRQYCHPHGHYSMAAVFQAPNPAPPAMTPSLALLADNLAAIPPAPATE
jgi:hypothetical protein